LIEQGIDVEMFGCRVDLPAKDNPELRFINSVMRDFKTFFTSQSGKSDSYDGTTNATTT